ncbi:TPA: SDR family NAD(P)-dependent oxidoreductase [Stenotrophomonas maltophilia]|nr:SDR family NAD(P)-dependent oxidoreductase [Stenotrophomonas maltophilia]HEL3812887.1 SDR family NAD(P)-dependent oxidoreductase [Stenotrophomonas maltophilia]
MRLDERVAIVTGAGQGLGRSHALYLAGKGARLVVNDVDVHAAEAVQEAVIAAGGEAIACSGSVTDEASVQSMVADALARWGRIDILVNNAGILRDRSFAKMSLDDFRQVMDVHLMGSVICSKAVWDIMRAQSYGRIVMTTSSSGLFGNFGQANYGAAKMALVGLMQTLAIEGARYGIRVNALAPTAATSMTSGVLSEDQLAALDPALVSPALLALVTESAPTRAILCAGAGHFARSNVTLTPGIRIGGGAWAGEAVMAHWRAVSDRDGEIVPECGLQQVEQETGLSPG